MTTSEKLETCRIGALGAARSGECARLHAACFEAAWDHADFDRFLCAAETIAHGAIDDDRVVGFVLSRRAADEAEVLTLAVAPTRRRRGLARRLLAAHLEGLVEAGVVSLYLEVDVANAAARALYSTFGFVAVGERKAYYRAAQANSSTALVLRLDLATGDVDA
jgi:ribosomal-protein-alanine N-acetyltransferase